MVRIQANRKAWGRLILAAFLFAWAGASAQPCLMGLDTGVEPAPMADHDPHAGHQPDDDDAPGVRDCAHCPPGGHQADTACASGLNADCGASPDAGADNRTSVQKTKDAPGVTEDPGPAPGAVATALAVPRLVEPDNRLKHASGPTLSIRHCVFLK